jgi:hypothetical protein
MVYSEAFDGLPASVKQRVYRRMLDVSMESDAPVGRAHPSAADRRAVLEILKDTKADFPGRRS